MEVLSELTKLQCLPFLRGLVLAGEPPLTHPHTLTHTPHTHTPPPHTHTPECPLCELDEYRVEVLILLRGLERLDKDEYTEDERADAEEVSLV